MKRLKTKTAARLHTVYIQCDCVFYKIINGDVWLCVPPRKVLHVNSCTEVAVHVQKRSYHKDLKYIPSEITGADGKTYYAILRM